MNYSVKWLLDELESENKLKYLFFWGHRPSRDGQITKSCFSQWWEGEFVDDNEVFKTAEHWMMAGKAKLFNDPATRLEIINSNSAAEAKKLGRKITNFDQQKWDEHKYDIVVEGNKLKFSQDIGLLEFLLNTKQRILVEASPVDTIWGNGLSFDSKDSENPHNWRGENLLGFALMEVRDQLKKP